MAILKKEKIARGFTFIELMVAIAIFLVVSGGIFTSFNAGIAIWENTNAFVDTATEARRAVDKAAWDLRQTNAGQIGGVPADGNWYNGITFRIPNSITSNGIVVWSANIAYNVGGLNNAQLLRSNQVVANNILSIRFRRSAVTPNIIDINVQSQKNTVRGYTVSAQASAQVRLRN